MDGIVLHFIARKTICVLRLIKFYWTWYQTIDLQGWQVCNEKIQRWPEIHFAYENLGIVNFKWSDLFGHNSEWNSNCILYLSSVSVFKATNLYSKEKQLEFDKTDPKVGIQISMMAISCPSFQDDYLGCAVKAVFCSNIVFNIISLCRTKLLWEH